MLGIAAQKKCHTFGATHFDELHLGLDARIAGVLRVQFGAHVLHAVVLPIAQQMSRGQEVLGQEVVDGLIVAVVLRRHGSIAALSLHGQRRQLVGGVAVCVQLLVDDVATQLQVQLVAGVRFPERKEDELLNKNSLDQIQRGRIALDPQIKCVSNARRRPGADAVRVFPSRRRKLG